MTVTPRPVCVCLVGGSRSAVAVGEDEVLLKAVLAVSRPRLGVPQRVSAPGWNGRRGSSASFRGVDAMLLLVETPYPGRTPLLDGGNGRLVISHVFEVTNEVCMDYVV